MWVLGGSREVLYEFFFDWFLVFFLGNNYSFCFFFNKIFDYGVIGFVFGW